jgi:hypothetical protein
MTSTPVYLEVGGTRVFAVMVDWPGWARAGRTAEAALEALTAYEPRYARVAARAGHALPAGVAGVLDVVEELTGDATTEFGAPGRVPDLDRTALTGTGAARVADLVAACWAELDEVAAHAPAGLRKGPRGGGRDRDEVVRHVLAAETSYVRRIGVRLPEPAVGDVQAIAAFRGAVGQALRAGNGRTASEPGPVPGPGLGSAPDQAPGARVGRPKAAPWPVRYAARRIAWHVLDHVWEIEDRSEP